MECKFYNSELTPIGILSHFVSLVWEEYFTSVGQMQMVVNKNSATIPLIKKRNFVGIAESETLMFIHSVEDKDGELWAYGIEAKGLLAGRVRVGKLDLNNAVAETALRSMIDQYGDIPCMDLGTNRGLTGRVSIQRTYGTLTAISTAVCTACGYGYTLRHDKANKKLLYEVNEGIVRSNAKFAEKYGNMGNLEYSSSEKDFANVAYVGGSGQGDDRIIVEVDLSGGASGFDKRSIWVEANDLKYEAGTDLEAYKQRLYNRGLEKLRDKAMIESLNFSISGAGFGRDYFLGDIVTADLPEYELVAEIRIEGVEFDFEGGVKITKLILGNPIYMERGN